MMIIVIFFPLLHSCVKVLGAIEKRRSIQFRRQLTLLHRHFVHCFLSFHRSFIGICISMTQVPSWQVRPDTNFFIPTILPINNRIFILIYISSLQNRLAIYQSATISAYNRKPPWIYIYINGPLLLPYPRMVFYSRHYKKYI